MQRDESPRRAHGWLGRAHEQPRELFLARQRRAGGWLRASASASSTSHDLSSERLSSRGQFKRRNITSQRMDFGALDLFRRKAGWEISIEERREELVKRLLGAAHPPKKEWIFLIGGRDQAHKELASVDMFELERGWRQLEPMKQPRVNPAVCVYYDIPCEDDTVMGAQVYVIGGLSTKGKQLTTVEVYDPPNDAWMMKRPMQTPRVGAFACCIGRYVYVCGGLSGGRVLNSVERFDTETNQWDFVAPMRTARSLAAGALIDGRIYVAGGRGPGSRCLRGVEYYTPSTDAWAAAAPMPEPTDTAAAGVVGGRLVLTGGFSPELSDEGFVYDPARNVWTKSGVTMRKPSSSLGGAGFNGCLVASGGYDADDGVSQEMRAWDVEGDRWLPMPPLLSKRACHGCVSMMGYELPLLRAMEADVEIKRLRDAKQHAQRYRLPEPAALRAASADPEGATPGAPGGAELDGA